MTKHRKRTPTPHALLKIREMLKKQNQHILDDCKRELPSAQLRQMFSMALVRGYNLSGSLETKQPDVSRVTEYTAFVNRAHNLVHLVPKDCSWHVRIPLWKSLQGVTDHYLERVIRRKYFRE